MKRKAAKSMFAGMLAVLTMSLTLSEGVLAEDDLPYDTYAYDYWEDVVHTPAAYEPAGAVSGKDLLYEGESIGAFVNPQDLCKSPEGNIYVADTGNHRIVVLSPDMSEVINIYTTFNINCLCIGNIIIKQLPQCLSLFSICFSEQ